MTDIGLAREMSSAVSQPAEELACREMVERLSGGPPRREVLEDEEEELYWGTPRWAGS